MNVTGCPLRISPISDSSTLAFSCIRVRSAAITKSVGAERLAATVWPTSTLREMTMPSIGEVMTVFARLTCAWFSDGARLRDRRLGGSNLRDRRVARHRRGVEVVPRDQSAFGQFRRARPLRLGVVSRHPCALEFGRGLGDVRLRLLDRAAIQRLFRRASTCPFRTMELKSAPSDSTVPDTCVPTCTAVTGSSVPVEETVLTMSPRVTAAAVTVGAFSSPRAFSATKVRCWPRRRTKMIALSFICVSLSCIQ